MSIILDVRATARASDDVSTELKATTIATSRIPAPAGAGMKITPRTTASAKPPMAIGSDLAAGAPRLSMSSHACRPSRIQPRTYQHAEVSWPR